jgi:urease accessory protein
MIGRADTRMNKASPRRARQKRARSVAVRAARDSDRPQNGGGGAPSLPAPCTAAIAVRPASDDEAFAPSALYRLMAWLSPAYPVGAFSYSGGIEWAVEARDIADAATLQQWLATVIADGYGFCDAVFFVHAYRAVADNDAAALRAVTGLAAAFVACKERFVETTAQGRAFLDVTHAVWPCAALARFAAMGEGPVALPVAVGAASAGHGIACALALPAFLQALAANYVSAGVRLIPLGQTDGQRVLAAMQETIAAAARRAMRTPLDEAGSCAFRADIAAMRHETQYTRLFRS